MYLQEILEVGVGLILLWLVMSVAAMSLQEWLSSVLQWRPKGLKEAIEQMLASKDLAQQMYQHPLITSLSPSTTKPGKKPKLPSYMPANKFSQALFDIVTNAGLDASPVMQASSELNASLDQVLPGPEQRKVAEEDWKAILDTAHQASTSQASLDSLKSQIQIFGEKYPEVKPSLDQIQPKLDAFYQPYLSKQNPATGEPNSRATMNKFHLGLNILQQTPGKKGAAEAIISILRSMELTGQWTVSQALVHLETWFNDSMDRLSGVYKRKSAFVSFLIGFIIAVLMNIDSINVAATLWREPTLRQAIVAQAQTYTPPASSQGTATTTDPLQSIPLLQKQLQVLNIPFGWTLASYNLVGHTCSLLPFGASKVWGFPSHDSLGNPICKQFNNIPLDPYGWVIKIIGMLITGAAAAQGAPFWFEILKKMVNVRGAGPNPSEQKPVG